MATTYVKDIEDMFKDYVINVKRPSVGKYLRGETDDVTEAGQALALSTVLAFFTQDGL